MNTYLLTGTSRGLGLEFTRQLAARGDRVLATCRDPAAASALQQLAAANPQRVSVHALDVTDPGSVAALAQALAGTPVDVLINNAGIYGDHHQRLDDIDFAMWQRVFESNVLGPMRVLQAFLPHLRAGGRKLAVAITSGMGSIGDNTSGGYYAYRSSKAALNMAMKSAAVDLHGDGIAVVVINPGWVQTDMGGSSAPLTPQHSIAAMLRVLDAVTLDASGQFLNHDGGRYVW